MKTHETPDKTFFEPSLKALVSLKNRILEALNRQFEETLKP